MDIKIQLVNINELRGSEYNPRLISPVERRQLTDSIKEYGVVNPLIVNSNPERFNIIVGGHQRWDVAKELGHTIIPVIYLNLTLEQERKLNLRLNRDYGKWDVNKLIDYDYKLLRDVGFRDGEIKKITEVKEETNNPEIEFTPELMEEQNYVLFYFVNQLDWQVVRDYFDIKPMGALDNREGYERIGIGRVLDGKKLLELIRKNQ